MAGRCACTNVLDPDRGDTDTQCVFCAWEPETPHTWSPSGARCTVCGLVGTGDPMNDGNCEVG